MAAWMRAFVLLAALLPACVLAQSGVSGTCQVVEVSLVVFLAKEAGFAVVPALDEVPQDAIKMDARAALSCV
jgi:hypothetical protein